MKKILYPDLDDCTELIQSAINKIKSKNGGTIVLETGFFNIKVLRLKLYG